MSRMSEIRRQQQKQRVEQAMSDIIKSELSKNFTRGLMTGAYAITQVILEKALEQEKTDAEKLQTIIAYCRTAKKPDFQFMDEDKAKAEVDKQIIASGGEEPGGDH